MSSKKDRFSSQDKNYMKLAINLARSRKGLTGDNPSVGCLIVKNDTIISIGQTGYNGRPHAEHSAIKNSFEKLKGSKMYVTLELHTFLNLLIFQMNFLLRYAQHVAYHCILFDQWK